MIRLLLAEDSAVQREFLQYILEESGDFEIIGTAVDGAEAVEMAGRLRPDIILMDCHMPKLDGVAAARIIMETDPVPIVMASATVTARDVQYAFDAMKSGALAMVNKPPALSSPDFDRVADELTRTLRSMREVNVARRRPAEFTSHDGPPESTRALRVIAITGSTGAPGVIATILTELASAACPPILIVQHIADGFVEGFALWLAAQTGMAVERAQTGALARRGRAYIAPDGMQMGIDKAGRIVLTHDAAEDGFCPSGSFLLNSVAQAFGSRAMGILLTGMGSDGVAGLVELQRAGGLTVVQDEESCVVFETPREALRVGAAMHVRSPEGIVQLITSSSVEPETPT